MVTITQELKAEMLSSHSFLFETIFQVAFFDICMAECTEFSNCLFKEPVSLLRISCILFLKM